MSNGRRSLVQLEERAQRHVIALLSLLLLVQLLLRQGLRLLLELHRCLLRLWLLLLGRLLSRLGRFGLRLSSGVSLLGGGCYCRWFRLRLLEVVVFVCVHDDPVVMGLLLGLGLPALGRCIRRRRHHHRHVHGTVVGVRSRRTAITTTRLRCHWRSRLVTRVKKWAKNCVEHFQSKI